MQAYSKFIRQQFITAEAEKSGRRAVMPEVGVCISSVVGFINRRAPRTAAHTREARPELPKEMAAGHRLHVNIVSHEVIQAPTLPDGMSAVDAEKAAKTSLELEKLLSLNIPLALGNPRPVKGSGASLLCTLDKSDSD